MPFTPVNMDDAAEDQLCKEDEYELEVVSAKTGLSKSSGKPTIACILQIVDPPSDVTLAAPVFHYISMPITKAIVKELNNPEIEEDDKESMIRKLRDIRRFLVTFGIPFTSEGFDDDDLVGATGKARIVQEEGLNGMEHKMRLDRVTDEQVEKAMGGKSKGRGRRRARA